jgi:hypothetical protein
MEVTLRGSTDPREFDIPLTTQYHFITPTEVKGRLTTEDYIFFNPQIQINLSNYDVILESFNGSFKKIGTLSETMKLPHVHFVNDALILIVPKFDVSLPKFVGTIQRGKTYNITFKHISDNGYYILN